MNGTGSQLVSLFTPVFYLRWLVNDLYVGCHSRMYNLYVSMLVWLRAYQEEHIYIFEKVTELLIPHSNVSRCSVCASLCTQAWTCTHTQPQDVNVLIISHILIMIRRLSRIRSSVWPQAGHFRRLTLQTSDFADFLTERENSKMGRGTDFSAC